MTSSTDLRTLSKYIVDYSSLFWLVQEVLKFVKKHERYSLCSQINDDDDK